MANKGLKPGSDTAHSGLHDQIGPRGGDTGETWKLGKPAHHKSGR